MAAKRMDLFKRTFFVLSGISNPLGKSLALEMCRRFANGSVALLLDENAGQVQRLQKELQMELDGEQVEFLTGSQAPGSTAQLLESAWSQKGLSRGRGFELAILVHNEGEASTQVLMEPQSALEWAEYVQRQLYLPVALNQGWQQFLTSKLEHSVDKLVVNVTSSLAVRPLVYSSLLGSCKRARDIYFRSMAAEESVAVLNYGPGLLDCHVDQYDLNGNVVTLETLELPEKILAQPRVQPLQAALKLINILEEISFVSGHDVDYYDTFVL